MTKIAIVDLEATGPNYAKGDRIIQIGAIVIEAGEVIHEYDMLLNPEQPIPPLIQQLTHIDDEQVKHAPTFKSVAPLWYERLKDCYFIAHHLPFDLNFLQAAFCDCGISNFDPIALDSLILSKIMWPTSNGFNLQTLSQQLNLPFEDAHNALADAKVTAQIVHCAMLEIQTLSPQTLRWLQTITAYLPHDSYLFFENSGLFTLNDCEYLESSSESISHLPQDESLTRLYIEHLLEQWRIDPYLHYQTDRPLADEMRVQLIRQLAYSSESVLLLTDAASLNQWQQEGLLEQWEILFPVSDFFWYSTIDPLVKGRSFDHYNQKEIEQLAALTRWLELTATGNLRELNQELYCYPLLREHFVPPTTNYFYQQQKKRLEQAQKVITTPSTWWKLLKVRSWRDLMTSYALVIDDGLTFYHEIQTMTQLRLKISETLTQLNSLLSTDQISHETVSSIEATLDLILNLQADLSEAFDSDTQPQVAQQPMVTYLSPQSHFIQTIQSSLLPIISGLHQVINTHVQADQATKQALIRLQMRWKDFLNYLATTSEPMLYLRATLINQEYYHWQFQAFYRSISSLDKYLSNYRAILYLSDQELEEEASDHLSIDWRYMYQTIKRSTPLAVASPLDVLAQVDLGTDLRQSALTDFQQRAIQAQLQELIDQPISRYPIIIATTTKATSEATYHAFTAEHHLSECYHIYCEGIDGNLDKIKRRLITDEPTIIITSLDTIIADRWTLPFKVNLLIQNLPFISDQHYRIQQMQDQYSIDNDHVFERLVLPLMQDKLYRWFNYLIDHFDLNQIELYDDRIYTRSYSQQLRQYLNPLVKFYLKE